MRTVTTTTTDQARTRRQSERMLGLLGLFLVPMILRGTWALVVRNTARPPPRLNCAYRSPHPAARLGGDVFGHHSSLSFASVASTRNHESGCEGDVSLKLVEEVATNLETIRNVAAASQLPHLLRGPTSAKVAPASDFSTVYLLGVSGGSDSVALFHLMLQCLRRHDGAMQNSTSLHVVHFDHKQRGKESTEDCEFVRRLCRDHGLPFHVYAWNEETGANVRDGSAQQRSQPLQASAFSQDAARTWRRRTMRRLLSDLVRDRPTPTSDEGPPIGPSKQPTVGILLTAHHLDDSNESMLLKLVRGTHLTNLQGMSIVHLENENENENDYADVLEADRSTPAVWGRPLLSVRKSPLVEFLVSRGLAWREDVSNQSSKYLRNRVRNELVPLLADLVSDGGSGGDDRVTALQTRLDRLSQQSREVQQYLDYQSDLYLQRQQQLSGDAGSGDDVFHLLPSTTQSQAYGHDGDAELDLVARHALHRWLARRQRQLSRRRACYPSPGYVSYDHIQRLWLQLQDHPLNHSWRLDIGEGWTVVRLGNVLLLEDSKHDRKSEGEDFQSHEIEWTFEETQYHSTPPLQKDRASLVLYVPSEIVARTSFRLCSATVASSPNYLSFWPPWRDHAVPIKDFLRGQKVPLHQRPRSPLVLYCESQADDYAMEVAAIYVMSKNQWVASARFAKATNGTRPIRIPGACGTSSPAS